jgi:hypothetical protein
MRMKESLRSIRILEKNITIQNKEREIERMSERKKFEEEGSYHKHVLTQMQASSLYFYALAHPHFHVTPN